MGRRKQPSPTSPDFLGKSPAIIYRIFPSKAAIWDAVAGDFLENSLSFPALVTGGRGDTANCLKQATLGHHQLIVEACDRERQMFKLVVLAAEESWSSFMQYRKRLQADVGEFIRAGIETKEFAPTNVDAAASCFCASVISLWDPRIIRPTPSTDCGTSAQELISFAVAGLRKFAR
ncbi:TetR/AcrR family transcriptional regulator [Rhizobium sp. 3T7]|nr:TetR/AcrR family transcriptional regulator [Rhizobium sp. 3T7]